MPVVGTVLLFSVARNFRAVHIQHHPLGAFMASAFASSSRLIRLRLSRFSSWLSTSVSNQCRREGNAAPRSQIFSEPIKRNVGSCDSRSASFRSSYPARRLQMDCRSRSASGSYVFFPRRPSMMFSAMLARMADCGECSR